MFFVDMYSDEDAGGWEPVAFCQQVREQLQSKKWFDELAAHTKTKTAVFIEGDEEEMDGCTQVGGLLCHNCVITFGCFW